MKINSIYYVAGCVITAALLVFGCGGGGGGSSGVVDDNLTVSSARNGYSWTYMVYLAGDNSLSTAGIVDIEEMAQVGSSDDVAIVVQAEFTANDAINDSRTRRFLVQQGAVADNLAASEDIGNVDMSDPVELTNFIVWAVNEYPADHYALVLWDHGAGWRARAADGKGSFFRGAIVDDTDGGGTLMSLPGLAEGVRNAGVYMDIINFDACLMAMYEVAYEFKGLVDYMVFSEEVEPGSGDPYNTILSDLVNDPNMSAQELASVIVERYDESLTSYSDTYGELTTKSAVDMSGIDALDAAVLALGQALLIDQDAAEVALEARFATQDYFYKANHDLYDLADYIVNNTPAGSAQDAADAVLFAVNDMVVISLSNPDSATPQNAGLAIFLPQPWETDELDLENYANLACNAVSRESAADTWGAFVEWEVQQGDYGYGGFEVKVTWTTADGAPCDADIDLWVIEPEGDFYAAWMGQSTPNGTFSPDSVISGISEEYYQANPLVQPGAYDFIIQYYADGESCTNARVYVYLNDSSQGAADLSLDYSYINSNDAANCDAYTGLGDYLNCLDSNYTDFVYLGYLYVEQRSDSGTGFSMRLKTDRLDTDNAVSETLKNQFRFGGMLQTK